MSWISLLKRLFERVRYGRGMNVAELARRLGMDETDLRAVAPSYHEFRIRKRSGGERRISAPDRELKHLQRRIARRLLRGLRAHPAAVGFERGQSIVTGAQRHVGRPVVVCLDVRDFFPSTRADRIKRYFRRIGWNRDAANVLVRLCTLDDALPQGAPTSPRLSNLVNYGLDARLTGLARRFGATYTRYADDLTFSFPQNDALAIRVTIRTAQRIVEQCGYSLHRRRKLRIRRRHQSQHVTGLVVNDRVNLPRRTRRWLRAVEHRARMRASAAADGLTSTGVLHPTLTPAERAGWRALQAMVARQSSAESP